MTALLAINPQRLQDNLVWLLPPLALLGAAQLDGLRRGAAAFINWFGIMAFGLIAVFLWLGFFAMNYGWPAKLAERAAYFSPYYTPDIDPIPMAVALLFTPLWLWAITRKNIRGRQAVTNWAAGVTLAWALLMTLFLPWLDAAKSHAPRCPPNGSRPLPRTETTAFRRPRMYQHRRRRPPRPYRLGAIQRIETPYRRRCLPLPSGAAT